MSDYGLNSRDLPPDLDGLEEDFELLRELGRGAITSVHLARERETGRLVAIKAIRRRYLEDEEAVRRFAREAQVVSDLDHPNIVRTYGVRELGERTLAIIMQYVQGPTLRDALLDEQPFPLQLAERVLADVASALTYAHQRGLVHRDVKPENIFIDEESGRVLLSDFGIARSMEGDPNLTRVGMVVGTPTYMSPEQIDGHAVDGRSDVYSLGVVGWEMLVGRRPWAGESIYGVMYKHKNEALPPVMNARPEAPRRLRLTIECALRKNRNVRCDAADFLSRLGTRERDARRAAALDALGEMTTLRLRYGLRERAGRAPAPNPWRARVPLAIAGLLVLAGSLLAAERVRVLRDGNGALAAPTRADSLRLCYTPEPNYQRACLAAQVADNDAEVTRAFQALIATLRRQAATPGPGSSIGPAAARALRDEQRAWIEERDRACRVRSAQTAGGRWALAVSRCLAERSVRRSADLRARLASLEDR